MSAFRSSVKSPSVKNANGNVSRSASGQSTAFSTAITATKTKLAPKPEIANPSSADASSMSAPASASSRTPVKRRRLAIRPDDRRAPAAAHRPLRVMPRSPRRVMVTA